MGRRDVIRPKNGHTLRVLIVCRISGCAKQKEVSLDDQEDNCKEYIQDLYDGVIEFEVIKTIAKGERLDRPEIERIEALLRSGVYDVVMFDDLSRLIRGEYAKTLLGIGKDHRVRGICIQDGVDTNNPTWEQDALNACSENVGHNERTSLRIKQKTMNRFKKTGGPTGRLIAGYEAPEGAKTYPEWKKIDRFTPIIKTGREMLMVGKRPDFGAVVDYFISEGFPPGPTIRLDGWHNNLVHLLFNNPILKGWPQRGRMRTEKVHGKGRRIPRRNPDGPEHFFHVPHLAHLTDDEFDSLQARFKAANGHLGRKSDDTLPPLAHSRADSRFPSLHAVCWYCGEYYVWGGNGISGNLMCNNSRKRGCWHSIGFSGELLTAHLSTVISSQLSHLPGFDQQFSALVEASRSHVPNQLANEWSALIDDEANLRQQKQNLQDAIKKAGLRPLLTEVLDALEKDEQQLLLRRDTLERRNRQPLHLPPSFSELQTMLQDEFAKQTKDSPEFRNLLVTLVPEIYVYAVRACDGGHLLPRAKIRLNLGGTFPDLNLVPGAAELLVKDLPPIDLFDPTQRENIREEAVKWAKTGLGPKAIAAKLKSRSTATAVQNALALQRAMDAQGIDSPYVTVLEPPEDYPKLRRHKHRKYRFAVREGFQRPSL